MRAAEIAVGQDYAYGTKGHWKTYKRCRVLEIGKHQVLDGSDKVVPAARIQVLDNGEGTRWGVLRSILMPWDEHQTGEALVKGARQAQAQKGPENAVRARHAIKKLAEIGLDTGTPSFELVGEQAVSSGYVRVNVEFLEEVLDALT